MRSTWVSSIKFSNSYQVTFCVDTITETFHMYYVVELNPAQAGFSSTIGIWQAAVKRRRCHMKAKLAKKAGTQ